MWGREVAIASRAGLVGLFVAAQAASASDIEPPRAAPAIAVNSASCNPESLTVAAGRTTFSIYNATSQAIEWEILDGVMVVEERENIRPGETKSLKVSLSPGDYQMTCGLLSNPKGALHVLATDGAAAKVTRAELIGPLAEYRVYVSGEIDALVEDMGSLSAAIDAGDLPSARRAYASAHAHYARIAPVALFFPDLDGVVEESGDPAETDPSTIGFRRLAHDLAEPAPRSGPLARKLSADVAAMRDRFEDLPLTLSPTFAGAVQTVGGSLVARLIDPSDDDLPTIRAYLAGVEAIVGLFRPFVARANAAADSALSADLSSMSAVLARYPSDEAGGARQPRLGAADRALLEATAKRFAQDLVRIPAILGAS